MGEEREEVGGVGRSGKRVGAEIFDIMRFLYFGLECAQNTLKVLLKSLCKILDYRLIFGVDTLTAERQGVALPVSSRQLLCGQTRYLIIDTILFCSCYYSNMCIADLHSARRVCASHALFSGCFCVHISTSTDLV